MTTGQDAYEAEVMSGRTALQRQRVLDLVRSKGLDGLTGSECDVVLRLRGGHVRLSELYALGLLEVCERKCSVTGRRVRAYRIPEGS